MFNVFVVMESKPGMYAEFSERVSELLNIVREEPGCVDITWGKVVDEEKVAIVERYVDEAARNLHLTTDAMKKFSPIIGGLSASAPQVTLFEE